MITNALIKENGNLSFFHRYNDKDVFICNSTNSAVNSGSSVVSNALAGNGGIKYLYVAYMNGDGTISYPSIQPSTDISYFTSLINPYGCIKVPAYLVGDVGAGMVTMQGITASNLTPNYLAVVKAATVLVLGTFIDVIAVGIPSFQYTGVVALP